MSNLPTVQASDMTPAQIELIRSTVAKGATNDEMKLFLYRCQHMGLDPLKPGQIHFVKYGNSPGTIIIGREGFRVRAAKTGKHAGTKIGVIRDDKGRCIGAWCEVYRSDWTQPAREEVSLAEYNTNKNQWAKMPETMIKKVAECAALRMAFPDELGGLYSQEEMDQAGEPKAQQARDVMDASVPATIEQKPKAHHETAESEASGVGGDFVCTFGKKYNGMTIRECVERDGLPSVQKFVTWMEDEAAKQQKPLFTAGTFFKVNLRRYADELKMKSEQDAFANEPELEF